MTYLQAFYYHLCYFLMGVMLFKSAPADERGEPMPQKIPAISSPRSAAQPLLCPPEPPHLPAALLSPKIQPGDANMTKRRQRTQLARELANGTPSG